MSLAAGALAALAVLLVAGPPRPARSHLGDGPSPTPGRATPSPVRLVEQAGQALRRLAGRRPDPTADRRVGTVAAVVVAAAAFGPAPALAGSALALLLARARRLRAQRDGRGHDVERDLPDVVDLLALAVGAGIAVPAAIPTVAPHAPPSLRPALADAADALDRGQPTDDAVVELGRRWGPPARPLVHALVDHLRYGTPVIPALERVATDARGARRRAAEARARRLPVLLLLPLVLCTLPAFGLLTVAPLLAGTFDSLRGGHLEAPASITPPAR